MQRLEKLLILQKMAVRIISKAEFLAHADPLISKAEFLVHTDPLFNKFGLLQITDIGNLQISIFVYTFLKLDLPKSFNEYFSLNSNSHHYFARQSSRLHIPFANTGMRQRSIKKCGPHVWNKVPLDITESISLPILKRKLKH